MTAFRTREPAPGLRGGWLLGLGLALLVGPMMAYPGNWSNEVPGAAGEQVAWATVGAVVFVSIASGAVLAVTGVRTLARSWSAYPAGTGRRAISDVLRGRQERMALTLSAAGYVLIVGAFLSLYGWSTGGLGVWERSYPTAEYVLCCGPIGDTPVSVFVISPGFELVVFPIVGVTVFLATLLFSMNIATVTALLRRRSARLALGGASMSTASAVLVNCPTCGTILLANILVGTAGTGLLVAWAAYSIPFMLVSFPLSLLSLVWGGRQLARLDGGRECSISSFSTRRPSDRGSGVRDPPGSTSTGWMRGEAPSRGPIAGPLRTGSPRPRDPLRSSRDPHP